MLCVGLRVRVYLSLFKLLCMRQVDFNITDFPFDCTNRRLNSLA